MTSTEFIKIVKNQRQNLQEVLEDIEEKLKKLPAGSLQVIVEKNVKRYFHVLNRTRDYLGKNKKPLIKQLQEKAYYEKLFKVIRNQIDTIDKVLKLLERTEDPESVFLTLKKEKRDLIEPYSFIETPKDKNWFYKKEKQKNISETVCLITDEGEKVRSKSELIIANKLHAAGVPYHYELPTAMGEFDYYKVRPDFTVLNKRTGEVFYWEHLGMIDNPEYCLSAQIKLENYSDCGLVPGYNLIITMESAARPLSTKLVGEYIEKYLL